VGIKQLVSAESGWRAVFKEPDGGESLSRVLGWAIVGGAKDVELVGVIVDPADPARIVTAAEAKSPAGGSFARYRYVPSEPLTVKVEAPPPAEKKEAETPTAEQFARTVLKRRKII